MNSMINLPDDVLINKILLKFDTKTLGKLRCVCKYLQRFIGSSAFVKVHYHDQINNNPSVLLVSGDKKLFYSLSLNGTHHIKPYCPQNVKIASGPLPQYPRFPGSSSGPSPQYPHFFGSCNGLLCLVERENSPPSLWNPTTKEYKQLPPPLSPSSSSTETSFLSHPDIISSGCTRVVAYGLAYDSIIDDYKVIQCENSIYRQYLPPLEITDFQVYTLGTDTWRRINDNPYKSHYTTPYHYERPGMFINGALHWILSERELFGSKIIAFDIEKEMFRADVPKPHSRLNDSSWNWSLHVLRGCLCIYERLHRESPCIDVWMMKDYGTMESWTKLFTFNDYYALFASPGLIFKVLNFCENGEVIVARDYKCLKSLILYDPINREHRMINLGEIRDTSYKEFHIESLVSLNTGIYRYGMVEN